VVTARRLALGCLIILSIVDGLLAYLLVLLSEMVFGTQPGLGGATAAVVEWCVALAACILAPVAGFILWSYRRSGIGISIAALPVLAEALLLAC
jgi:hypothetical protein